MEGYKAIMNRSIYGSNQAEKWLVDRLDWRSARSKLPGTNTWEVTGNS